MIMLNVFLILVYFDDEHQVPFVFLLKEVMWMFLICQEDEGSVEIALRASDLSGDQMFVFGLQFRIGRPMNFFGWIIL